MPITRKRIGQALSAFGAGVGGRGPEFIQQIDENRKQALLDDAFTVQQQLKAGDVPGARITLLDRLDAIGQLGGDPKDTESLLLDIERGDTDRALRRVSTVVDFGVRSGRLKEPAATKDASDFQFGAGKKVMGTTASGEKVNGTVTQRRDPNTGRIVSEFTPDVGAIDPNDPVVSTENVGTLGLTGQQQINERQADRLELAKAQTVEDRKRKISTLKVDREQGFIDEAISVGESLPEMKQALALLKSVKTGGFSAAAIRAKQFFGIESADEGELSSKLGVAVLARLRKTFGAQFTEREGDRLDKVSARMGANTATNIRLLETTVKRMEREIKRGLRFAEKFEDQDAFDLINDSLTFTFDGSPAEANDPRTLPGFDQLSPEEQAELLSRTGAQ